MRLQVDERRALSAAMDRYADGDDTAFGEIYDLLAPRLLSFFTRRMNDPSRSEDLVQQTLLQMHAARRHYASGSDVLPWAFAIARNALIDIQRRSSREVLFAPAEDHTGDLGVDRHSNPDDIAAAQEMADRVRTELDRLPATHRAAYDLVRAEGLSVAQTAEILGTTPTAVKLRVHRVYNALRSALGIGEASADVSR